MSDVPKPPPPGQGLPQSSPPQPRPVQTVSGPQRIGFGELVRQGIGLGFGFAVAMFAISVVAFVVTFVVALLIAAAA